MYGLIAHRGFESPSLRQNNAQDHAKPSVFSGGFFCFRVVSAFVRVCARAVDSHPSRLCSRPMTDLTPHFEIRPALPSDAQA
ncbi:hypothetical protein CBM2626_A140204 [Cupriavidus taiwanensis]|nr:hypothetical protein CBM2626_A140204 [Cupriavidus taiwanensis]